jgi:hypothetical protein
MLRGDLQTLPVLAATIVSTSTACGVSEPVIAINAGE